MCGLAALFAYRPEAAPIEAAPLRAMQDQMRTRGPDGQGLWIGPDRRIGLAHRRLSILDLSERAAQPFFTEDGRWGLVYNGEIYNYHEIRRELEGKGYRFRTDSDTEVVVRLYEDRGEAMLEVLRGMFAFALWDRRTRSLFLARDLYGIKPLYYADQGGCLWVASQVQALLAAGVRATLEPAGLCGFLLFGSVPEPWTGYRGISALPAGHWLRLRDTGERTLRAYDSIPRILARAEQDPSPPPLATVLGQSVRDSVRQHRVAHVPVGLFLSAGIDSGALAALLHEDDGGPRTQAMTLAFSEFAGTDQDESPRAAQIARRYGLDHRIRRVSEAEFRRDLPRILAAMDQPSIDGINTWFVSKAAREAGWKVALSGLGGDELLGGYPAFRDVPRWMRRWGWCARWPRLAEGFRSLYQRAARRYPLPPKGAGLLTYGPRLAGAWFLRRGLFMPWELPQLIAPEWVAEGLERLSWEAYLEDFLRDGPSSDYGRIALLETLGYLRNQLLRDADWAGMAHSLEIRVPLVDRVLLARVAPAVLAPRKSPDAGKQVLAQIPKIPLPPSITQRPKTGFGTPIDRWLAGIAPARRGWHWSRRWALVVAKQRWGAEHFRY